MLNKATCMFSSLNVCLRHAVTRGAMKRFGMNLRWPYWPIKLLHA